MTTPAETVAEAFSQANSYASNAQGQLTTFTAALAGAIYAAPAINVTFEPVAAPAAVSIPAAPAGMAAVEAEFSWDASGAIAAAQPSALVLDAPDLTIDEFTDVAPVLAFPDAPELDFGTLPVLDFGVRPTVPTAAEIAVPDAPVIAAVDAPSYLTLSTPTFAGVDTRPDYLANLETIPTLELAAPTPYSYALGAEYSSTLLTSLQAVLASRLAGGTGLDAAAEAAIWDRARAREVQIGLANEAEVTRTHEAFGFALPTGALAAALRAAQQDSLNKISTVSREIAVKQADLEQENLKQTIEASMQLEGKLVEYSLQLEKIAFESAKAVADNAVAVYNAQVDKFKSLLQAYQLYASAYDSIIKGELAKVEVFRAEIAAEQAKADTNRTLVEQYKAAIDAGLSQVKVFEAQVGAARTLVELEQAKIAAAGEEIKGYIAGINGETARLEAYKVGVYAQGVRSEVYKTGVDAQLSRVKVFEAQAGAFSAKAGAQADEARANLAYYNARIQAKSSEWDGWRARVQGEAARFAALSSKSNAILDSYKAQTATAIAVAEQDISRWQTQIKQYEAQQTYTIQVEKLNTEVIQANRASLLEAAKAGAQVYAQLTSSAYSMINASASVSASASTSASNSASSSVSTAISYGYSGDTDADVTAVTAAPVVPAVPAI
jgi:hypothetical protein